MFDLVSKFKPSGDQPEAIKELSKGIKDGKKYQVLLGATGTGKTFTIANVIKEVNKPTLVLAHNKTLAGQLYSELKEIFPNNQVCYFVSYYDYYQPEAYVPSSDTYIEKDSSINDEIDELRHYATSSLINAKDVIVVASVSCIYGIGDKEEYEKHMLTLKVGEEINRNEVLSKLVNMMYERNNIDLARGMFRAKGDVIEVIPVYEKSHGIRIELFGDEIERITEFDVLTGAVVGEKKFISIMPASHFVTSEEKLKKAIVNIRKELDERLAYFRENGKLLEAERLEQRCKYDLEMLAETGFCSGVENYSRHLALKPEGATPTCLLDFFPDDFLMVIDESHVTLPQVKAMYNGDRARKQMLVDYGFRLPSALDNRPLKYEEFEEKINQVIYVSATPGDEELQKVNNKVVEQIIRPTGLLDPLIEVRKQENQVDDLIEEIEKQIEKGDRTLVTTLTIRMAEELTSYLKNLNIKVAYLHSEVKTLERLKIIHDLREGKYDVLVGINLLREGLDIPEIALVAILDADKEGFLRSETSLIQTIGRAARNAEGHVIMYADKITDSMRVAIDETNRRRDIQMKYNREHGITPKTIIKAVRDLISISKEVDKKINDIEKDPESMDPKEIRKLIDKLTKKMQKAAADFDFESAIEFRDKIADLRKYLN